MELNDLTIMATLSIKGHPTRGKEVIELLEMFGGKNEDQYMGDEASWVYFIDAEKKINRKCHVLSDSLTLEDFLKKFPYRLGDKALYCKTNVKVINMQWNGMEVVYDVQNEKGIILTVRAHELEPLKKEVRPEFMFMDERPSTVSKLHKEKRKFIFSADAPDETELVLGDNFEIKVRDGKTFVVKKQSQYPKTYEECCEVLDIQSDWHLTFELNNPASFDLHICKEFEYVCNLEAFRKLLVCRDAYWKIAGEKIGLGKPWVPDYKIDEDGTGTVKFCIKNMGGNIKKIETTESNTIFAFPNAEMRDAFHDNFGPEFEGCKEFL